MRLVLLSGGSGKRLWPLSNDARSKQFLKVLENKNENLQSMVQRVWGQLGNVGLSANTIIATGKSQTEIVVNQLDDQAPLVVEPSRRDTFPAIALAAAYLYSIQKVEMDEIVAVLPVDPYVEDRFFDHVKKLETILKFSNADLALIGVHPTYPSNKYGYIVPNSNEFNEHNYRTVNRFTEKPTEELAKDLIAEGALWNCGVFAFRLEFLINLITERNLPLDYEELLQCYEQLEKTSFDYAVVEKAENIVMLSYDGFWKDLGTWNTLTEEMATSQLGRGIISEDSLNTHLINELDIPVTILGISNAVIAVSPDGILVADKEKSPKIKDLVTEFDDRPMYVERRWGWYRVLDHTKYENEHEVLTKKIGISAGSNLSYQYHIYRKEVWTVVKGEGIIALGSTFQTVYPGDVIQVMAGERHAIRAITDLEIIEVQSGSQLIEEDVVRLYRQWDEIEDYCYNSLSR